MSFMVCSYRVLSRVSVPLKTAFLAKSTSGFKPGLIPLCTSPQLNSWLSTRNMSTGDRYKFETLLVTEPAQNVLQVELNRPEKRNAMNQTMVREVAECFRKISDDSECRAIVLTGAGKLFTAGLDLMEFASFASTEQPDVARRALFLRKFAEAFQGAFTAMEKCTQPVIAAIHSGCIGGGVDMVTAADIRLCSSDTWFQIKEVDVGLAADVGTLQRFPKIVGNQSLVRELCYTARRFMAPEAKEFGLVSRVYPDKESLLAGALSLASNIAKKSPVAVMGTKKNLNYSRDHSVDEGLEYVATWNMAMLQTEDIMKAAQAMMSKEEPVFSKL